MLKGSTLDEGLGSEGSRYRKIHTHESLEDHQGGLGHIHGDRERSLQDNKRGGGMVTEITQRVSVAWRNWKRCIGVLCDRRMPVKLKGKVYKTGQTLSVVWCRNLGDNKGTRSPTRSSLNEMRMLRWLCGVTRRDKIRNEDIRGITRVAQASTYITEKRLECYGHVRRLKEEHMVGRMLDVDMQGK